MRMPAARSSRPGRATPCWPAASWRSIRSCTTSKIAARRCRPGEREALRAAEARPVWQRMRELLDGEAASRVLPKDKFAEALGYLRNQWDALQVYLGDGRLPIDNNETEQLMKQVAIGRKNWLFVGSVAAGERAADFLTIVSSAVRNDLDVWAYVQDVLDRLLAGDRDYAALRPDCWAASHPRACSFVSRRGASRPRRCQAVAACRASPNEDIRLTASVPRQGSTSQDRSPSSPATATHPRRTVSTHPRRPARGRPTGRASRSPTCPVTGGRTLPNRKVGLFPFRLALFD